MKTGEIYRYRRHPLFPDENAPLVKITKFEHRLNSIENGTYTIVHYKRIDIDYKQNMWAEQFLEVFRKVHNEGR